MYDMARWNTAARGDLPVLITAARTGPDLSLGSVRFDDPGNVKYAYWITIREYTACIVQAEG
jgi:hypothetical protein